MKRKLLEYRLINIEHRPSLALMDREAGRGGVITGDKYMRET